MMTILTTTQKESVVVLNHNEIGIEHIPNLFYKLCNSTTDFRSDLLVFNHGGGPTQIDVLGSIYKHRVPA